MAALRELGPAAGKADIARVITVMVDPELGTVIVTPDEALDRGDFAAIHARRKVLDRLAAEAEFPPEE